MSAWPEVVWLKQQIEKSINDQTAIAGELQTLTGTINNYATTVNGYASTVAIASSKTQSFINDNNFWTSIIPNLNFGPEVSYTTTIAGETTSVVLQDIIAQNNFTDKLDGATVFLTTDLGQDDVIQTSLDDKLVGFLNPEYKNFLQSINYTLKDTKWRIKSIPDKTMFDGTILSINAPFKSNDMNFTNITIFNNHTLIYKTLQPTMVYNASTQEWLDQNYRQIYFNSTDTQVITGSYKNINLINWLYHNAQLIEIVIPESNNEEEEGE